MAQKAAALSAAEFEKRYVTTNLRPDAPKYSDTLVEKYLADLSELDPEGLKGFKYAILTALFVGSHRADFVPKVFESACGDESDIENTKNIFYSVRECITVIWPFVGIPWTVPACLGLVHVLLRKKIEHIGPKTFRPVMNFQDLLAAGKFAIEKTYARVNNPEVRELLQLGFPDMRAATNSVVWGYNVGGAKESGLLTEAQTELLVATAITAQGATRQSNSHVKASLAMGCSFALVKKVVDIIDNFSRWNGAPLPNPIDVNELAKQV